MPATSKSTATAALILSAILCSYLGRPRGNRTPNLRFWRPTLCQLSYWPVSLSPSLKSLFDDLGDDAGAHGLAALADGKAQPLLHRNGRNQPHRHLHVVPRHHHLGALRQLAAARHIGRPEVELRPVSRKKRRMPAALFLREHVHLALELGVRGDRGGLGEHLPAFHLLALGASQEDTDVVPPLPSAKGLLNHPPARHPRFSL